LVIPRDLIDHTNKYAAHDISLWGNSGIFHIFLDGENRITPENGFNINPVGSGGNYIAFPMLSEIGFSLDKNQQATFSDLKVTDGVDMVYGLHVASQLPSGKVGVIYGPATSNSDQFHVTVKGKGGHSSQPDKTVDPIVIGAQIISNMQSVVSRMTSPNEELVVSITTLQAGEAVNVIPNEVQIGASMRSLKQDVRNNAIQVIERMVKGITEANGASYDFKVIYGYDSVFNEETATAVAERAIQRRLGEDAVLRGSAIMGGEDFSSFTNAVPGCFVFVGAKEADNPTPAPHHHPHFRIDEAGMEDGVNLFLGIAEELVF